MQHEHYFYTDRDTPPSPEQWVKDGWKAQHYNAPDIESVDENGVTLPASERAGDGDTKGFKVSAPVWREDAENERGGYWVITSEAKS